MSVTTGLYDREAGDEGFVVGTIGLEEWKVAAARIITRCWDDATYFDAFNMDQTGKLSELGFKLPPGLKLTLKKVDVKYEPNKMAQGAYVNGWEDSLDALSGEVIFNVPPAPDQKDRAMAIVDYQATGKSLPFTC